MLNHVKISDKINTNILLDNVNMLSVNRLNAHIKITETWKALNQKSHPFNVNVPEMAKVDRHLRSGTNGLIKEKARSNVAKATFKNDSVKVWNHTNLKLKEAKTLWALKRESKLFVKSLPM